MAMIVFTDGKKQLVKHDVAVAIWEILNDEVEPSEDQAVYCEKVADIYLNPYEAPDSYVQRHFEQCVESALKSWVADSRGNPLKPDPTDKQAVAFAEKWQLYVDGVLSNEVRRRWR